MVSRNSRTAAGTVAAYTSVFALTGAALALSLVLQSWIEPDFSPLFLLVVVLSTRWYGLRAGIVSTLITIPALLVLFLPPHYTLTLLSWSVALRLLSFLSTAALIVWLVQRLMVAQEAMVSTVEEVRTREERFRVALLKSPIVVFHQDADLRYIWVYNPFPEHAGMSFLDKADSDLFPPEEAEVLTRFKRNVLNSGVGTREEVTLTSQDGPRTMDVTIEPFRDSEGKVIGLLGTAVEVTERRRREEQLQHSREQFRSLAAHLHSIHETQRALTSRDIHDKVSQMLAATELELAGIADTLLEGADRSAAHDRLKEVNQVLAATIETSERISADLRPSLLDNLGLIAAIQSELREFQARTGIQVSVGALQPASLAAETSTEMFRIVQEALANIESSGSTRVTINLLQETERLVLQIQDNGPGVPEEDTGSPEALCLLGMQERARSFGGKITCQPVAGIGTTLSIEIPISATGVESVGPGGGNSNR